MFVLVSYDCCQPESESCDHPYMTLMRLICTHSLSRGLQWVLGACLSLKFHSLLSRGEIVYSVGPLVGVASPSHHVRVACAYASNPNSLNESPSSTWIKTFLCSVITLPMGAQSFLCMSLGKEKQSDLFPVGAHFRLGFTQQVCIKRMIGPRA